MHPQGILSVVLVMGLNRLLDIFRSGNAPQSAPTMAASRLGQRTHAPPTPHDEIPVRGGRMPPLSKQGAERIDIDSGVYVTPGQAKPPR